MKLTIQIGDHLWSPSKEDLETIIAMFSLPAKEDFVMTLKPENVTPVPKPIVMRRYGPNFPTEAAPVLRAYVHKPIGTADDQ